MIYNDTIWRHRDKNEFLARFLAQGVVRDSFKFHIQNLHVFLQSCFVSMSIVIGAILLYYRTET